MLLCWIHASEASRTVLKRRQSDWLRRPALSVLLPRASSLQSLKQKLTISIHLIPPLCLSVLTVSKCYFLLPPSLMF